MSVKEENKPLLQWIQENAKLPDGSFRFGVGGSFLIDLSILDGVKNLSESGGLEIAISRTLTEDEAHMDPSSVKLDDIDINITWTVIPPSIHPQEDEKFASQEWSKLFKKKHGTFSGESTAAVTVDLACEIIHFCHRLSGVKAFW